MTILSEGMRAGDLEDLVLPMVTADEFVSKVGDDAVVFGFYVSDRDAASDLNRFIQKSAVKLLDTEISPAPDQRGFYLVFFEILLNDNMTTQLDELLKEVKPLVKIEKWKFQFRGQKDLIPYSTATVENYRKHLEKEIKDKEEKQANAKEPKDKDKDKAEPEIKANKPEKKDNRAGPEESTLQERVLTFLTPSELLHADVRSDRLFLEGSGQKFSFDVVAFGSRNEVASVVPDLAMDLGLRNVAKEIRVSRMLGEGWSVTTVGGFRSIQHIDDDNMLIVRDRP